MSLPRLLFACLVACASCTGPEPASTSFSENSDPGGGDSFTTPFLGWSSWSVESTTRPTYGTGWLVESHVRDASDALASKLGAAGYRYLNLDSYWNATLDTGWAYGYDRYGVPEPDPVRWPSGIRGLADYLHGKGQKLGLYAGVGLSGDVYSGNFPIEGTSCRTQDIVAQPLTFVPNGWNGMYVIDWSNPCAQAYYDSVARRFASWGVDLLKVDGTTIVNGPDIRAWQAALRKTGRAMWLTVSAWPVPLALGPEIREAGQSVRVDTDVECYCGTVSGWTSSVNQRWNDLPAWLSQLGPGHFPDLDSLPINNNQGQGLQDGLSDVERQSAMTFWSMASAPLYVGGDIYFMDPVAQAILGNPEVIAVDQAARLPAQLRAGNQQVWTKELPDGARALAVYNLGGGSANIEVDLGQAGLAGDVSLRDLEHRVELGVFTGRWTAAGVPAHGSRLVRATALGDGPAALDGYTYCASEYESCAVPGGSDVAYGAAGAYRYQSGLSGTVGCGNGTFGGDPAVGWTKACYTRPSGGGGPRGYTFCAGENGTCKPSGVVDVAWGADGRFAYLDGVRGPVACNDAALGDPAVGYGKACYTRPSGGGVSYEAEAGKLSGSAQAAGCAGCSGKKVGYLGFGGRLTLPHVEVRDAGPHTLTLHLASADPRTLFVSANGGPPVAVTARSPDWSTPTTVAITITLAAGSNTLTLFNDGDWAPDVDRVVVR